MLSGLLYIATTLTLLIAVSGDDINVLQGIVQAVSHMAARVGASWIVAPFALMLSVSIAGIGSAWLAGSARIPFVAGLDSYMPAWLGKMHPRYATPYAALIVQAMVSLILVVVNFLAFRRAGDISKLLSLAVVLQLVPFLYMFGALLKIAANPSAGQGALQQTRLILAGGSGLVTTILGIALAFFPAQQNQLVAVLRNLDVRRDRVLHRPRGVFLLCVRPAQGRAAASASNYVAFVEPVASKAKAIAGVTPAEVRTHAQVSDVHQRRMGGSAQRRRISRFTILPPKKSSPKFPRRTKTTSIAPSPPRRAAFDSGAWPQTTAQDRGRILFRLAERIRKEARAAGGTRIAAIRGKPIVEAEYDITDAATCFEYYGGMATKVLGHVNPVPDNALSLYAARAGGRRRADHSLELSAADGRVETRARDRRRLHVRAEACRADAADGAGIRRTSLPMRDCRRAWSIS